MSVDFCGCPVCQNLSNPDVSVTTAVTVSPAPRAETIFDLVKADLDERDLKGAAEYGNGRSLTVDGRPGKTGDWLREAYEEALDLAVYLRGALAERESKK